QMLTESLVLSSLGGAAGFALAWFGTRAITVLAPERTLPDSGIHIDWSVLAYTLAIATACGVLFGIAPALWSARRAPLGRGARRRRDRARAHAVVGRGPARAQSLAFGSRAARLRPAQRAC